jgi:hypothetical protein
MVLERELAGLLNRADWTKLALSGTVTTIGDGDQGGVPRVTP